MNAYLQEAESASSSVDIQSAAAENPYRLCLAPSLPLAEVMPPKQVEDVTMEVIAHGTVEMLTRPCVDCGRFTGCFCDYCFAKDRIDDEQWAENQRTPLCTSCDRSFDMCHFCRKLLWVRQPAWR